MGEQARGGRGGLEVAWAGTSEFAEVPRLAYPGPTGEPRRVWALPLFVDRHRHVPAAGTSPGDLTLPEDRLAELARLRRDEFVGHIVDMGVGSLSPWPGRPSAARTALRGLTGTEASPYARRYASPVRAGGPAREAVHENVEAGATLVKIIATGSGLAPRAESIRPVIDRRAFDEIAEAARDARVPIAVHCHGGVAVDWCLEARVSTVEHGLYIDRSQLRALRDAGVTLTLTPGAYVTSSPTSMGPVLASLVRAVLDEGIGLAVGTDSETETMRGQLELLVELGMPTIEAIAATTDSHPPSPPDGMIPGVIFERDPALDVRTIRMPLGVIATSGSMPPMSARG